MDKFSLQFYQHRQFLCDVYGKKHVLYFADTNTKIQNASHVDNDSDPDQQEIFGGLEIEADASVDPLEMEENAKAESQEVQNLEQSIGEDENQMKESVDDGQMQEAQAQTVRAYILEQTGLEKNPDKAKKLFIKKLLKKHKRDLMAIKDILEQKNMNVTPDNFRQIIQATTTVSEQFKQQLDGAFGEFIQNAFFAARNIIQNQGIMKKIAGKVLGTGKVFLKRLHHDLAQMSVSNTLNVFVEYEMKTPEFVSEGIPSEFSIEEKKSTDEVVDGDQSFQESSPENQKAA